jgi:hypothetical protein
MINKTCTGKSTALKERLEREFNEKYRPVSSFGVFDFCVVVFIITVAIAIINS